MKFEDFDKYQFSINTVARVNQKETKLEYQYYRILGVKWDTREIIIENKQRDELLSYKDIVDLHQFEKMSKTNSL